MKNIKLKTLTLDNFRGQSRTLSFNDGITEIRAYNGAGKSTIFNAWIWLLVGTDSSNRSNFDLFDSTQEVTKDTPAATVEAVIDVDGVEWNLMRSAKSQWVRPRGKEEFVKANSDKYTFYVDNCEVQASVYQDKVSELFAGQDADLIKMFCNPLQSENIEWRQLRSLFQRIIGEIKESDFKGDYSLISDLIAKLGYDTAKQATMNHANDYSRRLKILETDLAAKERTLPDLSDCDDAQQKIDAAKARIAEIDAEIVGLGEANKPLADKRREEEAAIVKKRAEIQQYKFNYDIACQESLREYEAKYRELKQQNDEIIRHNASIEKSKQVLEHDIIAAKGDVEYLEEALTELRKRNAEVKARVFDDSMTCPTCNQPLPFEQVEAARKLFNENKDKEHEAIVKRGVETKARKEARQKRLEELEAKRGTFNTKDTIDLTVAKSNFEAAKAAIVPFNETDTYQALNKELTDMETNRTVVPETPDTTALVSEKKQLLTDVQKYSEITAYRAIHERIKKDIAVKRAEVSATAQQLAEEEHKLFKFTEYERERADIISCRVNRYLKVAEVKMLTTNKNGELSDCCVVTMGSVGSTKNRASRIIAGVDVAQAFQQYFELKAPIFIDDADCIADELIPTTAGQQIRLRFDETYKDKPLTVL